MWVDYVKTKNVLYFDTETLSLNPFTADAKLITAQAFMNDEWTLLTEWRLGGERQLIDEILKHMYNLDKWTPMVTYNGMFDVMYIMGRMHQLEYDIHALYDMHEALVTRKNVDLIQYDKGYFVSLNTICNKYGIKKECEFDGKDITWLYRNKRYSDIVAHGIDDVARLFRLCLEVKDISDRFFKNNINII